MVRAFSLDPLRRFVKFCAAALMRALGHVRGWLLMVRSALWLGRVPCAGSDGMD